MQKESGCNNSGMGANDYEGEKGGKGRELTASTPSAWSSPNFSGDPNSPDPLGSATDKARVAMGQNGEGNQGHCCHVVSG